MQPAAPAATPPARPRARATAPDRARPRRRPSRAPQAFRNAKDLVKLAKLTKQTVELTIKEKGKPRETKTVAYSDAPGGGGLDTTQSYADRAVAELLGASLALDAAVKAMK